MPNRAWQFNISLTISTRTFPGAPPAVFDAIFPAIFGTCEQNMPKITKSTGYIKLHDCKTMFAALISLIGSSASWNMYKYVNYAGARKHGKTWSPTAEQRGNPGLSWLQWLGEGKLCLPNHKPPTCSCSCQSQFAQAAQPSTPFWRGLSHPKWQIHTIHTIHIIHTFPTKHHQPSISISQFLGGCHIIGMADMVHKWWEASKRLNSSTYWEYLDSDKCQNSIWNVCDLLPLYFGHI